MEPAAAEIGAEAVAPPSPAADAVQATTAAVQTETAPADRTPVEPAESARLEAEKEEVEEHEFVKAGFKPKTVKGERKYCESAASTGSRIGRATTQCYSPAQVRSILAARSADKT
jgi:hypothetical protein